MGNGANSWILIIAALCALAIGAVRTLESRLEAEDADAIDVATPAISGKRQQTERRLFREVEDECDDLLVGDGRTVDLNWRQSPTRVPAGYKVHRKAQQRYEVLLNLKFSAHRNYDGGVADAFLDQKYRDYAAQCIRQFGGRLRDQSGRRLELRVLNDDERALMKSTPRVPIKIGARDLRDSSLLWSSNITCPVVMHELMHLLGLVDEYKPVVARHKNDTYDCRITGPSSSIMNGSQSVSQHARVLWPGHVNAVLYPACREKNERYYICAQAAYRGGGREGGCPDWSVKERLLCADQCTDDDCDWLE